MPSVLPDKERSRISDAIRDATEYSITASIRPTLKPWKQGQGGAAPPPLCSGMAQRFARVKHFRTINRRIGTARSTWGVIVLPGLAADLGGNGGDYRGRYRATPRGTTDSVHNLVDI